MFKLPGKANKNKSLSNHFYLELSLYVVIIAILPIVIIGTLSYTNIKRSLENEIGIWNKYVIENSKNAFELNFNQMLYQSGYLITSNNTQEYEAVFNSLAFEQSNSVQDLNGLNEYLFYKKNLIKMMSSMRINNFKYIDDIYFYDSEKDMILTTEGDQRSKATFYDKDWYDMLENNKNSFIRMDIRTINKKNNGVNDNIVTLIYRTANKNNAFIVNIDIGEMYNSITRELSVSQGDSYIYSKDAGKLISGKNPVNGQVLAKLGGPERVIAWTEFDRKVDDYYLVSWVKSERLGWHFINVKDLRHYYVNIEKAKSGLMITSGILLLLLLVLSAVVSRRIYKPFKRLVLDKFNMQNKLNENVPALQNLFKYSLVKGKIYADEEVDRKLAELNLALPGHDLVVLLAQWEGGHNEQIREVFEKRLLSDTQGFSVEIDGQLCCVVAIRKSEMRLLDIGLLAAKNEIRDRLGITMAIGVGRHCDSRAELNRAFVEAFEALKYRFVFGDDEIIFFEDIQLSGHKSYSYPFEKEKALRNSIMTGDLDEAQKILKHIIDELTHAPNAIGYKKLQQYFQMLVSGIMKTVDMLGVEIEDVFGPDADGFEIIGMSTGKEQFYGKCSQLLQEIMKYVSRESTKKSGKDMNRIIAFIEENYCNDISLVDAASVVGFNPSYVSRLIKNHTGKSFTDFVADKRMKRAEYLLTTTALKLDDITQQIGYQNAYYFIKVFRKYYGTTPSKYRQARTDPSDPRVGDASAD